MTLLCFILCSGSRDAEYHEPSTMVLPPPISSIATALLLLAFADASNNLMCKSGAKNHPSITSVRGDLLISGGETGGNVNIATCGSGTITFNGQPLQSIKGDKGDFGAPGESGRSGNGTKGDKGTQGTAGPAGPKGAAGIQGPTGIPGNKGATGTKGETGAKGPTGQKGEQGTAIQGGKGNKGEVGPQGLAGPPGGTQALNTTVESLVRQTAKMQQLATKILDCNDNGLLYSIQNDACRPPFVSAYALQYASNCSQIPRNDSGVYTLAKNGLSIIVYCDMTIGKSLGGNGQDQVRAATSCVFLKQKFNVNSNGYYWIDHDSDAEDTSNAVRTYCLMTSKTPVPVPASLLNDNRLVNFYVFTTSSPNADLKKNTNLSISSGHFGKQSGLNLLAVGGSVASFSYTGQTIVMLARREFGLSGTSGMVFQTSNYDDGITITNDFIGGRTHTSSFNLKGTKLSNILPQQSVASSFGLYLRNDGVEFWTEKSHFLPTSVNGGPFDSLIKDRFRLGSDFDSWDDGAFIIEAFLNYNQKLSTSDVQKAIKDLKSL
eukprot:m.7395 g.7395  ORF g.7395 m.7395 type:complete len:547 (+) comp18572_c0_seq1:54-1694(+)